MRSNSYEYSCMAIHNSVNFFFFFFKVYSKVVEVLGGFKVLEVQVFFKEVEVLPSS